MTIDSPSGARRGGPCLCRVVYDPIDRGKDITGAMLREVARPVGFHWFAVYEVIGWIVRAAMVPVILRRQFRRGQPSPGWGLFSFTPISALPCT